MRTRHRPFEKASDGEAASRSRATRTAIHAMSERSFYRRENFRRYLVKRPGQRDKGEGWRSILASCSNPGTARTTHFMRSI